MLWEIIVRVVLFTCYFLMKVVLYHWSKIETLLQTFLKQWLQ